MSDSAKDRRLRRRREERERQARMRKWHNTAQSRIEGAHPPTEDELANAPHYAEKAEQLLELVDGDVTALAELLIDVAAENSLKTWSPNQPKSRRSGAVRSLRQLLDGHPTMDWVMDIIDTACEEFLT